MGSKKPQLPMGMMPTMPTMPVATPAMKQALNNAKKIASGKATLEMSYGAIGMVHDGVHVHGDFEHRRGHVLEV